MFSDDLFASRGRLKMGLRQFTLFWRITEAPSESGRLSDRKSVFYPGNRPEDFCDFFERICF